MAKSLFPVGRYLRNSVFQLDDLSELRMFFQLTGNHIFFPAQLQQWWQSWAAWARLTCVSVFFLCNALWLLVRMVLYPVVFTVGALQCFSVVLKFMAWKQFASYLIDSIEASLYLCSISLFGCSLVCQLIVVAVLYWQLQII